MHTETYTAVVAKLKRGGRERLDGFLSSEFFGITADERSELTSVFTKDNDFQALSVLLPEGEFAELLRNSIGSLEHDSDGYACALIWAAKVGATDDALEKLVACMESASIWAIGSALSFLGGVAIPAQMTGRYFQVLVDVLSKKVSTPAMVLKASAELLRLKGVEPRSAEYIELSNRLQAKDRREKEAALAELVARATSPRFATSTRFE